MPGDDSKSLKKQSSKQSNKSSVLRDRTVVRAVRNLFLRASLSLSVAAQRLRQLAEEALSSEEVVNELFLVSDTSSVESSVLLETTTGMELTGSNNNNNNNNNGSESGSGAVHWGEFDAVDAATELRRDAETRGEAFSGGATVWEQRRAAWVCGSREERASARVRLVENTLTVPRDNYAVVYSNLVEKQKTLKKPMNLRDALRVINAGWIATRKWERAAQNLP